MSSIPWTIDDASEPMRMFGELLEPKIRILDFAIFLTFTSFTNCLHSRENTPLAYKCHSHAFTYSCPIKAEWGNFCEIVCDVATLWQLWGQSGNYGVYMYMAVTGSTWCLQERCKIHVHPVAAYNLYLPSTCRPRNCHKVAPSHSMRYRSTTSHAVTPCPLSWVLVHA